MTSLRARLVAAAAGSIVVALLVFGVAADAVTDHELHAALDRALKSRARDVARLAVSAPAVLSTPGALESPAGGRQVSVEVLDKDGRILARSVSLGARLLPRDPLVDRAQSAGHPGYETVRVGGERLRLYAAPIAQAGGAAAGGVVLVASETGDIENTARHLRRLLVALATAAAVLATLLAFVLTRRGLRPLRRLTAGAQEIEQTADPARRLPAPAANDEIAGLTAVLNRMLSSLDAARAAERRFLADASHELRTPVTALVGNAEYALRHGATPEVLADLRADADRLARLVDDLLVLERRAEPAAFTDVRLDALAQTLATDRVVVDAPAPVTIRGDAAALERALRNLVENALVHGPDGGRVTVAVRAGAAADPARPGGAVTGGRGHAGRSGATVTVSDEGEGPADRERIFERFWRAPEAAGRPGSGLGLAIVKAVAERHGGWVKVVGSTFTLTLTASSQPTPD